MSRSENPRQSSRSTSDSSFSPLGRRLVQRQRVPSGFSTVTRAEPSHIRCPATSVRRQAPERSAARSVSSLPGAPPAVLPQLAHPEAREHRAEPARMIGVGMRDRDRVQADRGAIPEEWRQHPLAHIEAPGSAGPPSTRSRGPSGSSTRIASPWPTSRKVTRSRPSPGLTQGQMDRASAGGEASRGGSAASTVARREPARARALRTRRGSPSSQAPGRWIMAARTAAAAQTRRAQCQEGEPQRLKEHVGRDRRSREGNQERQHPEGRARPRRAGPRRDSPRCRRARAG